MGQQYAGDPTPGCSDPAEWAVAWAASGAAGLSGRPHADPLGVPIGLVQGVVTACADIATLSASALRAVQVDGLALLGERAAFTGWGRRGAISCGGAARLLRVVDGWIALSLARPDDVTLLAAWLEGGPMPTDVDEAWDVLAPLVSRRGGRALVERATMLGLPCTLAGETLVAGEPSGVVATPVVPTRTTRRREPLVVDLSSLWAGPLCADLLGRAGCRIVKVESMRRPDGARFGPAGFYDLLHGGHESVALDFTSPRELLALRALLERADVVIEASRPRALEALGLGRDSIAGPDVWVSITGHGRTGSAADRVAFGDDAAVAGSLVTEDDEGLCFCCDAVADPLAGMLAARSVLQALDAGGTWHLDVALSRVARSMASGPLVPVSPASLEPPRSRTVSAPAPVMGEHTEAVLAELGINR